MKRTTEIVLTLPFPPSANRIWRNAHGATYLARDYVRFKSDVYAIACDQVPRWNASERYAVTIDLYPETRRRFDVDNRIKPVLDALTAARIWNDDTQVVTVTATKHDVDRANPRAVVTVQIL